MNPSHDSGQEANTKCFDIDRDPNTIESDGSESHGLPWALPDKPAGEGRMYVDSEAWWKNGSDGYVWWEELRKAVKLSNKPSRSWNKPTCKFNWRKNSHMTQLNCRTEQQLPVRPNTPSLDPKDVFPQVMVSSPYFSSDKLPLPTVEDPCLFGFLQIAQI